MVDILLLQTVSIVLASASVVAGVVYYALQLRHQAKTRTTDLALRLDAIWYTKDFIEWYTIVRERDPKEYETWVGDNPRKWVAESQINNFYSTLGFLLYKKLVNIEFACELFNPVPFWERMRVLVEKVRKETNNEHAFEWFEYLYNRAKKRRERLEARGVIRSAPLQ